MSARATGKEIVEAVVENLRQNLEPLATQTLVPSVFHVYLHQADFERLRTVFPRLVLDTKTVLDGELERLNRESGPREVLRRLLSPPRAKSERPAEVERYSRVALEWEVQFQEDPNDDLGPGDVAVMSELALPQARSYGGGSLTRRVQTKRAAGSGSATSRTEAGRSAAAALARLHYVDAGGERTYRMVRPEITIGRVSSAVDTDLRLETSLDVSRRHVRIRHRMSDNSFWIRDLSSLGTTLNGAALPRPAEAAAEASVEGAGRGDGPTEGGSVEGGAVQNGDAGSGDVASQGSDSDSWVPLPDGSRIGLAGVLTIDFRCG